MSFFVAVLSPFIYSALREAREEFGNELASKLKLTKDGRLVLWPQPSDDPADPQNVRSPFLFLALLIKITQWSDAKKGLQLFIIVLAAMIPDFNSGIGLKSLSSESSLEL